MSNFWLTMLEAKGEQVALSEMDRATNAICAHLKVHSTDLPTRCRVAAFLDSEYGAKMAQDVLKRTPVAQQLQERPVRFNKHFLQVVSRAQN